MVNRQSIGVKQVLGFSHSTEIIPNGFQSFRKGKWFLWKDLYDKHCRSGVSGVLRWWHWGVWKHASLRSRHQALQQGWRQFGLLNALSKMCIMVKAPIRFNVLRCSNVEGYFKNMTSWMPQSSLRVHPKMNEISCCSKSVWLSFFLWNTNEDISLYLHTMKVMLFHGQKSWNILNNIAFQGRKTDLQVWNDMNFFFGEPSQRNLTSAGSDCDTLSTMHNKMSLFAATSRLVLLGYALDCRCRHNRRKMVCTQTASQSSCVTLVV